MRENISDYFGTPTNIKWILIYDNLQGGTGKVRKTDEQSPYKTELLYKFVFQFINKGFLEQEMILDENSLINSSLSTFLKQFLIKLKSLVPNIKKLV